MGWWKISIFSSTFSQHNISFILDFYFFKFFSCLAEKKNCLILSISFDFALDLKRFRNFFSYTTNVKVQVSLVIRGKYTFFKCWAANYETGNKNTNVRLKLKNWFFEIGIWACIPLFIFHLIVYHNVNFVSLHERWIKVLIIIIIIIIFRDRE